MLSKHRALNPAELKTSLPREVEYVTCFSSTCCVPSSLLVHREANNLLLLLPANEVAALAQVPQSSVLCSCTCWVQTHCQPTPGLYLVVLYLVVQGIFLNSVLFSLNGPHAVSRTQIRPIQLMRA